MGRRSTHYNDVIMGAMASEITSLTIVYSTVYSGADHQRKQQSSASLAFVRGIHRWPVNLMPSSCGRYDDVIVKNAGTLYGCPWQMSEKFTVANWRFDLVTLCIKSQRAKLMGPTWKPPGSCQPQVGPMLAPWTLLSGEFSVRTFMLVWDI